MVPAVVNTVAVPAVPVAVIVVVLISAPDDEKDDEEVKDEDVVNIDDVLPFISEEDSKEGHANTIPSEPDDQPKPAAELELIVGEEPKINTDPSPSVDLIEELEDEDE